MHKLSLLKTLHKSKMSVEFKLSKFAELTEWQNLIFDERLSSCKLVTHKTQSNVIIMCQRITSRVIQSDTR